MTDSSLACIVVISFTVGVVYGRFSGEILRFFRKR